MGQENKTNKTKEEKTSEKTKLIINFIASIGATIVVFFRFMNGNYGGGGILTQQTYDALPGFGKAGIVCAMFFLIFGILTCIQFYPKIKNKWNMSRSTWLLIVSAICGAAVSYAMNDGEPIQRGILNFVLAAGITYIFFTIFDRFDYRRIQKIIIELTISLWKYVVIPSMFLVFALMGKIDTEGVFLEKVASALTKSTDMIHRAIMALITAIYTLGKYEYSLIFIIAVFVVMLGIATVRFYKKGMKVVDTVQPDPQEVRNNELRDLREEIEELEETIEKTKDNKENKK